MKKLGIITILLLIVNLISYSATITASVGGGEWTSGASWVGGVTPSNGDDVIIPVGSTITITSQTVNFNGTLLIDGTLSLITTGFNTFANLTMNAASTVTVSASGQIISGGGGAFDFLNGISIGFNVFAYLPGIGIGTSPQTGPSTIDNTPGGPMPVELLFFDATIKNQMVELTWATATEENFDYFALERSSNGKDFIEIAQIQGMGDSFERVDYSTVDKNPMNGRSYYRLRSVDFDGLVEVFDYVMVKTEGLKSDFSVYPNPIDDGNFSIQTNFELKETTTLFIYNSMGGVERSYQIDFWKKDLNLNGLKSGSYIVKMVKGEEVIIKRVLVN